MSVILNFFLNEYRQHIQTNHGGGEHSPHSQYRKKNCVKQNGKTFSWLSITFYSLSTA